MKPIISITLQLRWIFLFCLCSSLAVKAADIKTTDILSKHLESVGSEAVRRELKTRMALGTGEFIVKVPYAKSAGRILLASDERNLMFLCRFNSVDYPLERIGYFKSKVEIPFIKPGYRSPLGTYLLANNKILSDGLLGGVLLSTWYAFNAKVPEAKIEFSGQKKINGRNTFVLNYIPKGGFPFDSSIRMYFDAENFRHLRTEYRQQIPAKNYQSGIFSGDQLGGANLLTEDFSDFKSENGVTLPYSYKISLALDSAAITNTYEWNIKIAQYVINQKFDSGFFSFEKSPIPTDKSSF